MICLSKFLRSRLNYYDEVALSKITIAIKFHCLVLDCPSFHQIVVAPNVGGSIEDLRNGLPGLDASDQLEEGFFIFVDVLEDELGILRCQQLLGFVAVGAR